MNSIRIAFGLAFGICFTVWSLGAAAEDPYSKPPPYYNPPLLKNDALIPILPDPSKNRAPQIQEPVALPALVQAAPPATIRAQRVELTSSDARELGYLVMRLNEIDSELLKYRREVGAESFSNLLESLLAAVTRRAPNLSSNLEQSLPNINALLNERGEINRQILKIVTPGASMNPGPYVEPTRSGPANSNYQVYSSKQPATGAVVGPNPSPACHQEERTHREYRNVQLPNGFNANGTPLFRNEYHPFPVSEMVTVCP